MSLWSRPSRRCQSQAYFLVAKQVAKAPVCWKGVRQVLFKLIVNGESRRFLAPENVSSGDRSNSSHEQAVRHHGIPDLQSERDIPFLGALWQVERRRQGCTLRWFGDVIERIPWKAPLKQHTQCSMFSDVFYEIFPTFQAGQGWCIVQQLHCSRPKVACSLGWRNREFIVFSCDVCRLPEFTFG